MSKSLRFTLLLPLVLTHFFQTASFNFDGLRRPALAASNHKSAGATVQSENGQVNVLTHHNNVRRTGANLQETVLNTANVNERQFGKLFSRAVDGYIYAQPLYASQINFPDQTIRNVIYVATENNSLYAFDADDPETTEPLWQVNLGAPVPSSDLSPNYRDLVPQVGITGTPVIDLGKQTIYVVAKSKDTSDGSYHQRLHALELATGLDRTGSPVEITASVAGDGSGSVNGTITFNPLWSLNRPGLLLLNGVVYIGFGSHGNLGEYHGWLLGYDATTLQQVGAFNTSPNSEGGSIWMSGQGLIADDDNNIYVTTGNGPFDLQNDRRDYGDCALKFSTANGLTLVDYFTPHNTDVLNAIDADLGAGGPVLLPGVNRLIFTGKDTVLRVLDTNNLGGFDPVADRIVQQFQPSSRRKLGAPVFWESPTYGPVIYYWAGGDNLKVYKLLGGKFQEFEAARSSIASVVGISNAAPMSLSANGNKAGTGILWATGSTAGDANRNTVPGVLRAFDASDITRELWNSQQNPERDDIGNFAKFCPPTVANGKVYVPTFAGQLQVYGLLPGVCNFSLSQTGQFVNSGDENGNVNLTVEDSCNWLASTNDDWINITSGNEGSGSGPISFTVEPNPDGLIRTGTINIGGLNFTIKQAGSVATVSAASFDASRFAPDSIAATIGSNLSIATESASNALPTGLAGTTLKVTDSAGMERLASLLFVSPTQINYLIPAETAVGSALITVHSASGNIATGIIRIEAVAPGIFSANSNGQGVAAAVALRVKSDGAQFFEPVSRFDESSQKFIAHPIDLGEESDQVFLILFGTGLRFRSDLSAVKTQIGDSIVQILFAGAQGDFAGLDQINLPLPRNLSGKGDVDIVLTVDGRAANIVTVNIK